MIQQYEGFSFVDLLNYSSFVKIAAPTKWICERHAAMELTKTTVKVLIVQNVLQGQMILYNVVDPESPEQLLT